MKKDFTSPEATEGFARELSLFARPGMVILLEGDLGSGKSTFARAFIKSLSLGKADFDVPSPTFSLLQSYDQTRVPVAHVDLYRLKNADEAEELGLQELAQTHLLLIEWPKEKQTLISADTLGIRLSGQGKKRNAELMAHGAWVPILLRNETIKSFLKANAVDVATRRFFEGDASTRRYEKVIKRGKTLIVMDMPQRPDGPPVKDGKPYSAIAHLAENIRSVVAINDTLFARGYGAPEIKACDIKQGLALIEDLGDKVFAPMTRAGRKMDQPLKAAVEVLAKIAGEKWPEKVKLRDRSTLTLSAYDTDAQLIEVDLLPQWFFAHIHGKPAPQSLRDAHEKLWREILPYSKPSRFVWTLRDYHSPNLLWLPKRKGVKRVGLIDTQDAVLGHPAYDLVSMLQDARVDVSAEMEAKMLKHYVAKRKKAGGFDEVAFARAYAVLGAQRSTKILGIFARLNARDGKPQYLQHMPRVSRYLARNLEHPALHGLRDWLEANLPDALAVGRK